MRKIWFLILSFGLICTVTAQQKIAKPPADLDTYVARVMTEFEVPGIGLAIVKDGRL